MNAVEIKKLSFGYNGKEVLKNINIQIKMGEFVCVVGENGSGKSTLMKCILGLNVGYKGEIIKNGRAGYLPQRTEIQSNFPASVKEVVLSGTIPNHVKKFFYTKEDKEIANNMIKELKIEEISKKCFGELSGGQQQRVLIARALCSAETMLILDEPVNGLDPSIAKQIYRLLAKLNKEKQLTIIMVSHDIDRALEYCNRVIEIQNGKVTYQGEPSSYKTGRRETDD